MKTTLQSVTAVLILSLLWTSLPVHAAVPSTEWDRELTEIERNLLSGDYAKARKKSIRIAEKMTRMLGPGEGSDVLFGLATLYRALSEAGLGEERDACWYWHLALAFNPLLVDFGLDRFGEPGRLLLDHEEPDEDSSRTGDSPKAVNSPGVTGPQKRHAPKPDFPRGARYFGVTGVLVVLVVIDREGVPVKPVVLSALPAPSLTWAGLEALKQWRFEPARLDGKPIPVFYSLSVNYRLRR